MLNLWLNSFKGPHDGSEVDPCDFYISPTESGGRYHSLIFYIAEDREGAEEEAERLHSALAHCSTVKLKEWSSVGELRLVLHEALAQVAKTTTDCELLIVCVMGHGTVGSFTAQDGSKIPANDILHLASQEFDNNVPMVRRFAK